MSWYRFTCCCLVGLYRMRAESVSSGTPNYGGLSRQVRYLNTWLPTYLERVYHDTPCRARTRCGDSDLVAHSRASHGPQSRSADRAHPRRCRRHPRERVPRHCRRHTSRMGGDLGTRHPWRRQRRRIRAARRRAEHLLRAARPGHRCSGDDVLGGLPAQEAGQYEFLHHHDGVYAVGAAARAGKRYGPVVHRLGACLYRFLPPYRAFRLGRRGGVLPHADPHVLWWVDAVGGVGGGVDKHRLHAPDRRAGR